MAKFRAARRIWANIDDYSRIDTTADYGVDGIELNVGEGNIREATARAMADQIERGVAENLEYVRRKGLDAGVCGPPMSSLQTTSKPRWNA